MQVYFLSGLGADKTVFQLLDVSWCTPVFIDWIKPQKRETLQQYALRLKAAYNIPDDAVIVGLSFGGILATEIAKQFPQTRAILLASAKTRREVPAIYRAGRYLPFHNWLPAGLQKWFMLQMEKRFGITSEVGKKIYHNVIEQADISFNAWAVGALLRWDNMQVPPNLVHIHGTADKILFFKNIDSPIIIQDGGHLMIIEQAGMIGELIKYFVFYKT